MEDDVVVISFRTDHAKHASRPNGAAPQVFVAGPENRLAAVAIEALLNRDNSCGGPVVFCGASGTGKTHLAHGVAEAHGDAVCVQGADFARELNQAIERGEERSFQNRNRAAKMLVLDGLSQLVGRRAALRELLHTMDALEVREIPVVITTDTSPAEMTGLSPAMRSRLCGGLVVPLAPPGVVSRQAIVERLAMARGLTITRAASRLLADNLNGTAAVLQGAVLEIFSELNQFNKKQASVTDQQGSPTIIELDHVRRYLESRRTRLKPSLKRLMAQVAKFYGLTSAALRGPSRRRQIALARSVAIYLGRITTGSSLETLGRHFGGRDHTTALHSFRSIQRRLTRDPELRIAVDSLHKLVAG